MPGTDTLSCPPLTVRVVEEIVAGAVTAVKRPLDGVDVSVTRTLEPSAPRPVRLTVLVPDSLPNTTLTILRVGS
ncbi:hypothetical protein [Nonomuraea sp. NPDC049480]|uniref:hypothetical protein n=1 Tax=Nonomuraea sp. NPDC049480 TaxID=3364353 RepID=UPI00379D636A